MLDSMFNDDEAASRDKAEKTVARMNGGELVVLGQLQVVAAGRA